MFHVPNQFRIRKGLGATQDSIGNYGCFEIPSPAGYGRTLIVIASQGESEEAKGWQHVSVHAQRGDQDITPYWDEMQFIKTVFWDDEDLVMQLHPPRKVYVNIHPHVLHLWRPTQGELIPMPPQILV